MGGSGFYAEGIIDFASTLEGNTELIGAHLHTGSSTTNGPVNVIFCGSAPLPEILTIDGPCSVRNDVSAGDLVGVGDGDVEGRYIKSWEAVPYDDLLTEVYTNGGNNATSVAGADTLADGAPTTFASFQDALMACTVEECEVYFNIHTKYSFDLNAGAYGLARAQLTPITCKKDKLKEGYKMETAKCFLAMATSNNTNLVTGIPNQLAPDAGSTPGHDGQGMLVVYQGGTGPAPEDSATPDMGNNTTEAAADVDKFTEGNQPDQQADEQDSDAFSDVADNDTPTEVPVAAPPTDAQAPPTEIASPGGTVADPAPPIDSKEEDQIDDIDEIISVASSSSLLTSVVSLIATAVAAAVGVVVAML